MKICVFNALKIELFDFFKEYFLNIKCLKSTPQANYNISSPLNPSIQTCLKPKFQTKSKNLDSKQQQQIEASNYFGTLLCMTIIINNIMFHFN